ncbi:MAG TPA: benzoate-CoA ligase family protein [Xanthobacteraceae bacterium]|jgi:benzoate-CoA ligase|nr:benzoate-CoA ligase family protein [Xanthobacteraceae bacterium]
MSASPKTLQELAPPTVPPSGLAAIPRDYNFVADILKRNLDAGRGDKTAFIDPDGAYSYAALADRVDCFVRVLRSLGVRREERILLCLLDTIDWPTAFLGAIKAGVVAVPVNTLMTEDDYRFMLRDSRARVLVVSEAVYGKFAGAIEDSADLDHVIVSGGDGHDRAYGRLSFNKLMAQANAAGKAEPAAPTTRDDMCFWLYTSGSTGRPKGAVHTHADLKLTDDLYAAPLLGITENDICYSVAKLFFAYGLGNALTFPMSAGATTVLLPARPTPETVAELLKTHRVTVFYAVPTFYAAFLASAAAPARAELTLRRCVSAGEALPPEIGRRWSERYGCDILDGIGSTEMLHIFVSNRPGDVKYGTTGKPVPGYDVRLVDDDGNIVSARGEMGELQVRGPTSAIMYWNNRDQSRATFLGDWTRSGDKYVEDEDGYFVYCGRRDDMLKVSGMYVSPFEVEGALQSHPDVLEAAVVGWPDTDRLIKPKAFVVLKAPEKASEALAQALQDACRQKLAVYKYPRWIEFRSELPKTATGKIQRFKLRAEADAS